MNSSFSLPRYTAIVAFAALMSLLAGCGQKGPLYLDAKHARGSGTASASAAAPAIIPAPIDTPASIALPVTP